MTPPPNSQMSLVILFRNQELQLVQSNSIIREKTNFGKNEMFMKEVNQGFYRKDRPQITKCIKITKSAFQFTDWLLGFIPVH